MRIENEILLDYSDVLLKPKRSSLSSRKEVDLEREFTFKYSGVNWKGIPIFSANMDTSGTFEIALEMSRYKMLTAIHKFYKIEAWRNFFKLFKNDNKYILQDYIVPSIGLKELNKFREIVQVYKEKEIYPKFVMLDVANGYTERFVNFVKEVREEFEDITIIAGNVATAEGVEALVFAGADICKIGIGSGKSCLTRKVAGVGIPQFSSVIECADAAHGLGAQIVADGGIKEIADFSKSFGAGADFVMAGDFFAGHEESGGELITKNYFTNEAVFKNNLNSNNEIIPERLVEIKQFKEVYGMSSTYAMEKYYGKKDDYRASEGEYSLIPYKGKIKNTIEELLGGTRSACTYLGSRRIKDMSKCATFVRVNRIK